MRILIAPDKFKGSLTARGVCDAVARGLQDFDKKISVELVPLADGGDGTCDLLTQWHGGTKVELVVPGPRFAKVTSRYGISADQQTAFIEMAEASGLTLLRPEERNPLLTTTLGTGELIADALRRNVRHIILGLGGSATNDGGMGMARALGYEFTDSDGQPLEPIGENLIHVRHIDIRNVHPRLKDVQVVALCDVTNPFCGPDGAAFVYGGQKGGDQSSLELLDAGLRNFRRIIHKVMKTSVDFPGAGAAGGLGGGARVFLHASMEKGIHYMMRATKLEEKIGRNDLIITGEGKIDHQTFSGKVVAEVAGMARRTGKPVVAVCGKCEVAPVEWKAHGIRKVVSLVDGEITSEMAIKHAADLITLRIKEACKDLTTG